MDVSGEGLGGHVPTRECGGVVALCGEVGVVQPNVGLKRTGVNTYLVQHRPLFDLFETTFIVIFTVELSARWLVSDKSTVKFFRDCMNFIDLLALLPWYIEVAMLRWGPHGAERPPDMRVLRIFRLMRVFKLTRHSEELQ